MSRAVTPARRTKGPTAHAAEGDGARLQLVKYFPIETGLTYIGLASVVVDATKSDSPGRKYWLLAIFVALLVVTIADLYRLYPKAEYAHPIVPIAISGGAFIMWVYALRDLAQGFGIYNGLAATVLTVLYALVAIRIVPEPKAT